MLPRGVLILRDRAELVPGRARNLSIDDFPHVRRFGAVEKQSRRADELERVPLDRVVARRDGQTAGRVVVLDRELHRRRRHHADVEHVAPDRLERGVHHRLKHRARHAAVAADDDRRLAAVARERPRAEAGGKLRDDLRRERLTHAPAHAGDAHHQSFIGHRCRSSGWFLGLGQVRKSSAVSKRLF